MSEPPTIGLDDVNEYLAELSDFGFELAVLKELSNNGLTCLHSGTYTDPITNKTREYDLRVEKRIGSKVITAAVECKNISAENPIVIHRKPREDYEAFQDYLRIRSAEPSWNPLTEAPPLRGEVERFGGVDGVYKPGDFVGKSIDQIHRDKAGNLKTGDSFVFEKMSQAVNSAYELIEKGYFGAWGEIHSVTPLLVIPDGRMWAVDYDLRTNQFSEPRPVEFSSFFIGKTWQIDADFPNATIGYTLSHLDIVSIGAIPTYLQQYLLNDHGICRF